MKILTPVRCKAQDCIRDVLASSGPLDLEELAAELQMQCPGVDSSNAVMYAVLALADLIQCGDLEQYDDECAFDVTDKVCNKSLRGSDDPCCDDEGKTFDSIKYRP